jgi:hypothetical protein
LLLLPACAYFSDEDEPREYALTWTCLSPEGCTRTEQVELIDRVFIDDEDRVCDFQSTRDGFTQWAELVVSDSLPPGCFLVYNLALFAHELEPFSLCLTAGDFELTLSIPDRDPATHSKWRVQGRDLGPAAPIGSRSTGSASRGALETGE